jgi:transposase-like protein
MDVEEPEKCPNCGSKKIKKIEEEISEYTWKVRVNRWKCEECGAHWDLNDPTYFEEWKKKKEKEG